MIQDDADNADEEDGEQGAVAVGGTGAHCTVSVLVTVDARGAA